MRKILPRSTKIFIRSNFENEHVARAVRRTARAWWLIGASRESAFFAWTIRTPSRFPCGSGSSRRSGAIIRSVIFLAEAFTRPKVMYRLAKLGFDQSYTYFAWKNSKCGAHAVFHRADAIAGARIFSRRISGRTRRTF